MRPPFCRLVFLRLFFVVLSACVSDAAFSLTASAVGAVAGQHGVGNDGSAQYSIPLNAPAGIQGVQPEVALAYSSNGGNGVVGVGFDVTGVSRIHRCGTNFEREGFVDGVDFDGNDQFCLDGQRLVAVSGGYGAAGTEYRTENDSITKVVSFGSEGTVIDAYSGGQELPNYGGNPIWFKVWSADGKVAEYGRTANARNSFQKVFSVCPEGSTVWGLGSSAFCYDAVAGVQTPLQEIPEIRTYEWSVSKIADRYNNRMEYTYEGGEYEKRINRVDYNFVQGSPLNSVRFFYESRYDQAVGYFAGAPVRETKRLRKVASYSGEQEIRALIVEYSYNAATYDSIVSKIWECAGGSEVDCTSPTEFFWEPGASGFASTANNSGNSAAGWDNNPLVMDVNGDGRADLVQADGGKWRIMLSSGEKYASQVTSVNSAGWEDAKVLRYNTDKYDDILFAKDNRWYVLEGGATTEQTYNIIDMGTEYQVVVASNPTLTEVATDIIVNQSIIKSTRLIDINGDSLKDMIYTSGTGWFDGVRIRMAEYDELTGNVAFGQALYPGLANDINFSKSFVFDINGDGREDILAAPKSTVGGKWDILLSNGLSFSREELSEQNSIYENFDNIKIMDFNGDGLQDIILKKNIGFDVRINTGDGFKSAEPAIINSFSMGATEWKLSLVYDYNGDGRDDILYRSGNTWHVLVSNGVLFQIVSTGVSSVGWDRSPVVSDMTGNGMPDLTLNINGTWQTRPHNSLRPDYLTKVVNGMGVETEFQYRFLTDPKDPDFYDRGDDVGYPLVSLQNASYLVSEVRQSDGWEGAYAGMNSTSYQYKRLLIHQKGFGNLGFEQIKNINNDTGIETVSTFSQDYQSRTHGSIKRVTTSSGEVVLSDTVNTWEVDTICGAGKGANCTDPDDPSRRYILSPAITTVSKRDLNGAFLHTEVVSNPSAKDIYYGADYGSAGDARTMTSVVKDESGNTLRTKTTTMRYDNNISAWLMGMVRRSEVVSDISDGTPISRVSEFDYDTLTGRKAEERILNPSNNNVLHRTRYGINAGGAQAVDAFGRNLAVTISGPDFTSRTSSVSYDSSQRYIATETNALSHSASYTYYPDSSVNAGLRKTSTDPNGLVTAVTYDTFGRPQTSTALSGTSKPVTTTTSYHNCSQSSDRCSTYSAGFASYYTKTVGGDGSQTRTYIDKLGRTVRKATLGFKEGAQQWVFQDTIYDHRGNPSGVSEPFYHDSGSGYWSHTGYDALDRPISIQNPDGRIDIIQYNGLVVTSIRDAAGKNQVKTEERDSLGNLVKVSDTAGNDITYTYNALGQMITTRPLGAAANKTMVGYDALGRKVSMQDPDKGSWSYTYNGLGQLITQTNARGEASCMAYDKLGRMVKRIDDYSGTVVSGLGQNGQSKQSCTGHGNGQTVAQWVYDSASGAGVGSLHRVLGADGYQKTLFYNVYGLPWRTTEVIGGVSYETKTTYDSKLRPAVVTYPGESHRLQVRHNYNPRGYLKKLSNHQSGEVYVQIGAMDARGNVTLETYGSGLQTQRAYSDVTGYLQNIATGTSLAPLSRQNLAFDFDTIGNLETRADIVKGISETFDYDNLNRLTHTYADFGNGQIQETAITYDALGNIRSKTGVGNYLYGSQCSGSGAGPHAVCSISGGSIGTKNATYSYDANGNMLSGDGRNIAWSLFDKPTQISHGGNTTSMSYGPERQLLTREDSSAAGTSNAVFVGGLYEKVSEPNGDVKERHYVGGHTIVTYKNRTASSPGTEEARYLHKDHIGSVVAITDESGNEVESFSFDPWGKRRAPSLADLQAALGSWTSLDQFQKGNLTLAALTLGSNITNKGFTGHEQLDTVDLIHMGGRVYDAEIGRFLSADPFVQDSTNLQGFNRYSYVENNPLSYTDPSGYFKNPLEVIEDFAKAVVDVHVKLIKAFVGAHKKVLRKVSENQVLSTALSIGVGIACGGFASQCVMTLNAIMTAANGGTIKQVLTGAAVGFVSGGLTSRLGGAFAGQAASFIRLEASNVAAAMIVGGAVAKAQGGKFIDGVKGAAVGAAIGYGISRIMQAAPEPVTAENGEGASSLSDGVSGDDVDVNLSTEEYGDSEVLLASKGGKQNISAGEFNRNSDPAQVEQAMKEAKEAGNQNHYRKLKGLLKVIKRGGRAIFPPVPMSPENIRRTTPGFTKPHYDLKTPEGLTHCLEEGNCA